MKQTIKSFYKNEVNKIKVPPMPSFSKKKRVTPWDNILLAAMAMLSLIFISLPSSYNSQIRSIEIPKEARDTLVNNFSRVINQADLYFLERKGVKND